MNSIIEVSPNIIAILGAENNSEFKLNQLRQSIQLENVQDIGFQDIYFCLLNKDISRVTKKESQGFILVSSTITSFMGFFIHVIRILSKLLFSNTGSGLLIILFLGFLPLFFFGISLI